MGEAPDPGKFYPEIFALRPWYHDFSRLGIRTVFTSQSSGANYRRLFHMALRRFSRLWSRSQTSPLDHGTSSTRVYRSHRQNQTVKEQVILDYVQQCMLRLDEAPHCLDLFCADGYYSCHLQRLRAQAQITGVDLDSQQIARARTIARQLGMAGIEFREEDAWSFLNTAKESYDLILCVGGLYHLSEPERFLVIQSVVTLETEDSDFFEQPARGWQHGCRFSHAWLKQRLLDQGWEALAEARRSLPGNRRLHDKGSSFFLCTLDPLQAHIKPR